MKKSIIISCAGKGSRLGKGIPKCLVEIQNKTLIERMIENIYNEDEIIVVVGYKGQEVIDKVTEINKKYNANIKFVWNNDYEKTATGASFKLGSIEARNEFLIAIDGDMLVSPKDTKKILNMEEEFICGEKVHTDKPIYIYLNDKNEGIKFDLTGENLPKEVREWSGISGIYKNNVTEGWFMCDIMEPRLPLKLLEINAREIDTPNDLEEATRWVKNNYDEIE